MILSIEVLNKKERLYEKNPLCHAYFFFPLVNLQIFSKTFELKEHKATAYKTKNVKSSLY